MPPLMMNVEPDGTINLRLCLSKANRHSTRGFLLFVDDHVKTWFDALDEIKRQNDPKNRLVKPNGDGIARGAKQDPGFFKRTFGFGK